MKRILLLSTCMLLLFSCEYQDNGITSIDDVITSDYLLTDNLDTFVSQYQIVRLTGKPGTTTISIGGADLSKYQPCFVLYVATGTTPETTATSAIIKLDGMVVLSTSDFSKNGGQYKFEVCNLCPTSVLTVEVRGDPGSYVSVWIEGKLKEVDADGDGYTITEGDCDDYDASINPFAMEICGDNIDNNCDGLIDVIVGNNPPIANANGPYVIIEEENLNLNGTVNSYDADCNPFAFMSAGWNLYGDPALDIIGISPSVPWIGILDKFITRNQPINIQFVVTDQNGIKYESITQLTIYDKDFMACFTVTPSAVINCNDVMYFNASCTSHPDPRRTFVAFEWYFENTDPYVGYGDFPLFKVNAIGISQMYTYTVPGNYKPTLRVRDDHNTVMFFQMEITVI